MAADGMVQNSGSSRFDASAPWNITIALHNEQHQCLELLTLPRDEVIPGTKSVREHVDHVLQPLLRLRGWHGFGLWAQHEKVKLTTTFDEINYQRDVLGKLRLDCEDHACNFRAISTPVVHYDECVVCFEKEVQPLTGLLCMHFCLCTACFAKVNACPLCRKPKRHA